MAQDISPGRRGGRAARRALRSAAGAEKPSPIRPGLERKASFQVLGRAEVERIHHAALEVLETVGMADAPPSTAAYLTASGARLSDDGRIRFPRALVEDTIAKAGRGFTLCGREPRHDIEPAGSRLYFGTAGAAVGIVDPVTRRYRPSTLADLHAAARLVDALDNIHFFQRTLVACDLADPFEMDFNTCYASVAGTSKHVGTSWGGLEQMHASIEMLHTIAGGEDAWRARPFVSIACTFVVPPLKWAGDSCRALELAVHSGMPVLMAAAGQAGATNPAALAGAVVQAVAEELAALVYVNSIKPGAPAMFGPWTHVSDLRTGAMIGAGAEQSLMMAANCEMARFYDLPATCAAGIADSKMVDAQSGYEKGATLALAAASGANMVYEAAGMMASVFGFSFESLVLDNDAIGFALRCARGIEVDEGTLSVDVIRDVCMGGTGHYLGHDQTLSLMESEYHYPALSDRAGPDEWGEEGASSALERATAKAAELLASHHPEPIPPDLDAQIRARFPVRLDRAAVGPRPR